MKTKKCDVVVVGAGPGGYAAAFYAADLGKNVILVEKDSDLGGVCLNRGCIPSKALLNVAHVIEEAAASKERGLTFGSPKIELDKLRAWKNSIIQKLGSGVTQLAKARKVEVVHGKGYFEDSNTLRVETSDGQLIINYEQAVLAVGSRPALPAAFDLGNPRVMTSTEALELDDIPEKLLVIGGGYIGMELGTVYTTLGSEVTVVEAMPSILAGADADLIRPVMKYAKEHMKEVRLSWKVKKISTKGKQIQVVMTDGDKDVTELYDKVLVSVGRTPNSKDIGLENTKVDLDEKGFVKVNTKQETSDSNIYAIGDIAGGILLAHKAHKEARIAVENIVGQYAEMTKEVIVPAVVFTHPEVAWAGITEAEAKEQGLKVKVSKCPWSANGRALTFDKTDGLTKIIVDPETDRILGVGIVGHGAGELIAEGALAIEMGATAADIGETVHAHPTLSETVMEAAENLHGTATHLFSPKR
ncbi:dihydrolipoyl dehydrogenase [bacterium]|jgi:dihydrolipoamide dehydrogenase|nr:dihydrolipoyl dehydrogenase [bacterium]